ncbi:MAG: TfoX/Sxy family protein [Alphaproteobacteria bacterium]|jgi:TfoX/Sxy family transcriptional regulator of competence genes|nr:TfoX/Sxy family protein [Alphaproteobacteria bacterium]
MNAAYRQRLEAVFAAAEMPGPMNIAYKSVFGAVAAYADGVIFITSGNFGLALKLPGDLCEALMAEGVCGPLKYFEKGHIKRNYVVLHNAILDDKARMKALLDQSLDFIQNGPS